MSIRALRGGRSRAPLGDSVCPFPPHCVNAFSDTPLPTPHKGVIFARHCHAPLLRPRVQIGPLSCKHTHTRSLPFPYTHFSLAFVLSWHSDTAAMGPSRLHHMDLELKSAVNWNGLNTHTHTHAHQRTHTHIHSQTHLHTCGSNTHTSKACFSWPWRILLPRRTRTLILSYLSRWAVCVCVCVCVYVFCSLAQFFLWLLNYIPVQTLLSHPTFCPQQLLYLCMTKSSLASVKYWVVCVCRGSLSFKRVHAMLLLLCADFPCVNLTPTCIDNLSLSLSHELLLRSIQRQARQL